MIEMRANARLDLPTRCALGISLLTAVYASFMLFFAADASGAWPDDAIYRFQSKCLAIGRAKLPEPPEFSAFKVPGTTHYEGHWFGKYYPGFPAVLAVGEILRVPWLVNPFAAGLLVFGTYLVGRALASAGVGLGAAALLAMSPLVRNLATTYLSHVVCAACLIFASYFLVHARRSRSWGLGVVAGLCWGLGLATRPLTALSLAIPFAVVGLADLLRDRMLAARWGAGFAAAALAGVGGLLLWNATLTGNPLLSAYEISIPADSFGFADPASSSDSNPYTPAQARDTLRKQVQSAAGTLFPKAVPGSAAVLLAAPLAAIPFMRRRKNLALLLALASTVLVGAHFFYPGTRSVSAIGFGPRYYFEGVPAYFLLLAVVFTELGGSRSVFRWIARSALLALALVAGVESFPAHVRRLRESHSNVFTGQNRRLEVHLASLPPGRRVVFVDISTYNERSATLANRPDLTNDNLVAIYRQPDQNRAVLDAFGAREAFLFRWNGAFNAPELIPYVPEEDEIGPPRTFPYVRGKGMRFPPLEERAKPTDAEREEDDAS